MSSPASPLVQIALDVCRAVNDKDVVRLGSFLADNYTHQLWPSTMRAPDQHQRLGKAGFLEVFEQIHDAFIENCGLDVDHPVNVVEGQNCVVLQLTSHGVLKNGKPYNQEYLHIIRFNEDNKVVSDDEWLDSAYAMEAFEGMVPPMPGPDGRIMNVEEAKKANTQSRPSQGWGSPS